MKFNQFLETFNAVRCILLGKWRPGIRLPATSNSNLGEIVDQQKPPQRIQSLLNRLAALQKSGNGTPTKETPIKCDQRAAFITRLVTFFLDELQKSKAADVILAARHLNGPVERTSVFIALVHQLIRMNDVGNACECLLAFHLPLDQAPSVPTDMIDQLVLLWQIKRVITATDACCKLRMEVIRFLEDRRDQVLFDRFIQAVKDPQDSDDYYPYLLYQIRQQIFTNAPFRDA